MDFKSAFPKGDSIRAATVDNCASKLKIYGTCIGYELHKYLRNYCEIMRPILLSL